MIVRFKKLHPEAKIPQKAHPDDAGFDITCVSKVVGLNSVTYSTGLAIEIPKGYVGKLYPRSSIKNTTIRLSNCVGIIDSGYIGEIKAVFDYHNADDRISYNSGDRILQLLIEPVLDIKFFEVGELATTSRGTKGFGSTGN